MRQRRVGGRAAEVGVPIYDRLSATDRSFLDLEGPTTHMHVAGAFTFEAEPLRRPEGALDIERIRDYVASRLHRIPRYRQRIEYIPVENHPVWVDEGDLDLVHHVRRRAIPQPAGRDELVPDDDRTRSGGDSGG